MSDVYIFEHVLEAIENHAASFKEQEIYGWLLGYDFYDKLFVISSIPCYYYRMQSQISAEPSHEEVMEIIKAIPKGIGVVGIYHSHTGKVFHSKTDDQTIEQFATIYPFFLSIVTNVSETKYYQFKENSVNEINVGKIKKEDLVLSNFETSVAFDVEKIGERILTYVSTELREKLENSQIAKISCDFKELDDKTDLFSIRNEICQVLLEHPELEKREFGSKLSSKILLDANILSQKGTKISEVKGKLKRSFTDDMYYQLKNTEVKDDKLVFPKKIEILLDNILWKFYVQEDKREKMQKLFEKLIFRMRYMSLSEEEERKTLIDKYEKDKEKYTYN